MDIRGQPWCLPQPGIQGPSQPALFWGFVPLCLLCTFATSPFLPLILGRLLDHHCVAWIKGLSGHWSHGAVCKDLSLTVDWEKSRA